MLTVIVPVYKVEDTLDRCLRSVLNQRTDMEVILVDDGSPDRCPALCDEWARRDTRVRVIHQANKGLSEARNTGLDAAKGEYVTFIDSDDFLASGTYDTLMRILDSHPDYDILEFPVQRFFGTAKQSDILFPNNSYTDMTDYWLNGCAYEHAYAWNKIYHRALFDEVRFPEGRVFEDIQTLPRLLAHCDVVATTANGCYYYFFNENGITQQATPAQQHQLLEGHLPIVERLMGRPDIEALDLYDAFSRYYLHVLNIQITACRLSKEEPRLPDYRAHYIIGISPTMRLKVFLLRHFGIRFLCRLMRMIRWPRP